jgi:hypothetical protein
MTDYQSVAANTTTGNILAGKNKEFLEEPSVLTIGCCAAAIGMRMTCVIGTEVVVDDQEVSTANHMPIFPDDVTAEAGGFGGDRVTIRLRNTTAGAIVVWTKVNIAPA